LDQGQEVIFMGSSLGGFTSEYLAMKTGSQAIMINPAIKPSHLLTEFIGVTANYETGLPYEWQQSHCDQYQAYEEELANSKAVLQRTILLDMADELLDAEKTRTKYQNQAQVVCFAGGSHSFEHMQQALPIIKQLITS
jgi:predicted esterase YcpF (UPF0227 family)